MSKQMQDDFLLSSVASGIEEAAEAITTSFALDRLNKVGSVTIQECNTMYLLSKDILTEGSEDLIPDNIELPDDELDGEDDGGDFDLSDLEGIVLPTSDGGSMVIENGVLVPYNEEADVDPADVDPADADPAQQTGVQESNTNVSGVAIQESDTGAADVNNGTDVDNGVGTIQESSIGNSHSDVVASMIQQLHFNKGAM